VRAVYTGHEALTFSDYLDLETGKTLFAEPGGTYDIAPASGHVVPGFPVPWFDFAGEAWEPVALTVPEPGPEPEPQDVPGPGTEPEPPDEDGQSF
jgi:hypothetical protein